MNLLIKKIKRSGHGFRNFDNYRLRLLLHCGVDWNHSAPDTTSSPLTTIDCVEPAQDAPAKCLSSLEPLSLSKTRIPAKTGTFAFPGPCVGPRDQLATATAGLAVDLLRFANDLVDDARDRCGGVD